MIIVYLLFALMIFMAILINVQYYKKPNIQKIFYDEYAENKINLDYAMRFSVNDIVQSIFIQRKTNPHGKTIFSYKNICVIVSNDKSRREIKNLIYDFQQQICDKFGEDLKDGTINDRLLYIWLMESFSHKYRRSFSKIVNDMYQNNEITRDIKSKLITAFYN